MAHLLVQDDREDGDGGLIADGLQATDHPGRHVEPAGLVDPRDQGHAGEGVGCGAHSHGPLAIVGRKVAVGHAPVGETGSQQREVTGLLFGHPQPVAHEGRRQRPPPPEPVHGVEGQVHRRQLDVGHGVDQRHPTSLRAHRPTGHLPRVDEHGPVGHARLLHRHHGLHRRRQGQTPTLPVGPERPGRRQLGLDVALGQSRPGGVRHANSLLGVR